MAVRFEIIIGDPRTSSNVFHCKNIEETRERFTAFRQAGCTVSAWRVTTNFDTMETIHHPLTF